MIATVTNQGKTRWLVVDDNFNAGRNADLKLTIGKRVPMKTKAKLRAANEQHRIQLSQNPQRVRSLFQDKHVKYAA
jgi:hypothetical protein